MTTRTSAQHLRAMTSRRKKTHTRCILINRFTVINQTLRHLSIYISRIAKKMTNIVVEVLTDACLILTKSRETVSQGISVSSTESVSVAIVNKGNAFPSLEIKTTSVWNIATAT